MPKISEFSAISTLDDDDILVIVEDGTNKRVTVAELRDALGGGVVDPIEELLGAPDTAFEFDTSSLTGLTTLSATADEAAAHTIVPGHYFQRNTGSGGNEVSGVYAAVTPPFTIIVKMTCFLHTSNGVVGAFVGEATPGEMHVAGRASSPTGGQGSQYALHIAYNNPTSFQGAAVTRNWYATQFYAGITVHSSTDIDMGVSEDGYHWQELLKTYNPSMTIASAGFAMDCAGGLTESSADFIRIWDDDLTLPGIT